MTTNTDITLHFGSMEELRQYEELNQEMAQCCQALKLLFVRIGDELDGFSEAGLLACLGERTIDGWQTALDKRTEIIWEIERDLDQKQKAA